MVYNLVKYLQTELPTLVFTADGWLPTTPEEASTVIDNGGSAPPIINRYEWAMQVLSRALDKPTAKANINIAEMLNKSRGDYAYNIIDISDRPDEETVKALSEIEGVIRVRALGLGE